MSHFFYNVVKGFKMMSGGIGSNCCITYYLKKIAVIVWVVHLLFL